MTTERIFKCDLCGDRITPSQSAKKDGFGLYFISGGSCEFRRAGDCEHHICHQCAKSVHDELRKVTPT